MRNGRSSTRLTLAAAPRSSRKSLLAASCPGIGFRMNSGLPSASASDEVSPPGLVRMRSATAINSCMLVAKPSTCVGCFRVLRGEFAAQFLVAAGDDHGLKRLRHLVQFGQDFRDRSHAEAAAQHQQHRQVVAQTEGFADGARVGLRRKFCGDGNAGGHDVFRRGAARNEPRLGFLGRDAIQVHARVHPQRVRLKIGHDADDEGSFAECLASRHFSQFGVITRPPSLSNPTFPAAHSACTAPRPGWNCFRWRVNFLRELLGKARRSLLNRRATLGLSVLPNSMPPQFRRALDQLDVAVRIHLFVQWREKLDEVNPFDRVVRAQGAPRFVQGGGRGDVPAARCHGCNQDAHGSVRSLPERAGIEKQNCRGANSTRKPKLRWGAHAPRVLSSAPSRKTQCRQKSFELSHKLGA